MEDNTQNCRCEIHKNTQHITDAQEMTLQKWTSTPWNITKNKLQNQDQIKKISAFWDVFMQGINDHPDNDESVKKLASFGFDLENGRLIDTKTGKPLSYEAQIQGMIDYMISQAERTNRLDDLIEEILFFCMFKISRFTEECNG